MRSIAGTQHTRYVLSSSLVESLSRRQRFHYVVSSSLLSSRCSSSTIQLMFRINDPGRAPKFVGSGFMKWFAEENNEKVNLLILLTDNIFFLRYAHQDWLSHPRALSPLSFVFFTNRSHSYVRQSRTHTSVYLLCSYIYVHKYKKYINILYYIYIIHTGVGQNNMNTMQYSTVCCMLAKLFPCK